MDVLLTIDVKKVIKNLTQRIYYFVAGVVCLVLLVANLNDLLVALSVILTILCAASLALVMRNGAPIIFVKDNILFSVSLFGIKKRVNLDLYECVCVMGGVLEFHGKDMLGVKIDNLLVSESEAFNVSKILIEKGKISSCE